MTPVLTPPLERSGLGRQGGRRGVADSLGRSRVPGCALLQPSLSFSAQPDDSSVSAGELFHTLAKFVSIKTVADSPHREDCRQGALYLKRVLRSFGAEASLLPNPIEGKNPIVLATFRANAPPRPNRFEAPRRKRVLCYGHYDVVPASAPEMWGTDPFVMHGKDGWLYGRGVSDNKGPVLAVAAAAAERRRKQEMDVDLVMVIEGEEETGSAGFQEAIRKNRVRRLDLFFSRSSQALTLFLAVVQDLIGDIDVILVSNSYWLGETVPCLTFGLRGVIHASVEVRSDLLAPSLRPLAFSRPPRLVTQVASSNPEFTHSGIWGGVTSEPLNDLIRVLASLTDNHGAVRIPGFLDGVRKLLPTEQKLYDELFQRTDGCVELSSLSLPSPFGSSRLTPPSRSTRTACSSIATSRARCRRQRSTRCSRSSTGASSFPPSALLLDLPGSCLTPPSPSPAAGDSLRSRCTRSRCPARRRRRSSPTRRPRACRSESFPTRASTTSSRCSRRTSRRRSAPSRRPTRSRSVLVLAPLVAPAAS